MKGWSDGKWVPVAALPKNARPSKWKIDWRCQHHHRHREVVYGTKTEAQAVEDDYKAQVGRAKRGNKRGAYVCEKAQEQQRIPTVREFAARFLRHYKGREGLRSSYYSQRVSVIVEYLGDEPVNITRERLEQFRGKLEARPR